MGLGPVTFYDVLGLVFLYVVINTVIERRMGKTLDKKMVADKLKRIDEAVAQGLTPKEAAQAFGLNHRTYWSWVRRFKQGKK